MIHNDINKNLYAVFKDGKLPTMIYISKQDYENKKVARPLHSHDSVCELGLVFKGTGYYRINNKVYALEEGDLIFYNQNERHEVVSAGENEIGTYFFGITNLNLQGLPQNHFVKENMEYVKKAGKLFPFLHDICNQIYQLNIEGVEGSTAAQLLCVSLIVLVSQLETFRYANIGDSKEDQFVVSVVSYLDENYTEEINLEKLADHFQCSPSYISHTFKNSTGISPIKYIIKRRIGLAQNLLISSDLTATQIAACVGYDNSNYFTSLFLKITGITPIEYRKRYLKKLRGSRKQL